MRHLFLPIIVLYASVANGQDTMAFNVVDLMSIEFQYFKADSVILGDGDYVFVNRGDQTYAVGHILNGFKDGFWIAVNVHNSEYKTVSFYKGLSFYEFIIKDNLWLKDYAYLTYRGDFDRIFSSDFQGQYFRIMAKNTLPIDAFVVYDEDGRMHVSLEGIAPILPQITPKYLKKIAKRVGID